jgi:putative membrane protein
MKEKLSDQERQHLDRRVAEAEKRTGAQIVLAVVERSDVHAELPWKAFALGASLAGLTVTLLDLLRPGWLSSYSVMLAVTATLAAGAVFALLCIYQPGFARLFLDASAAEVEARQYAESVFLSREVFATRGRTGIVLLISLFERQVVVLPDTGLGKRLDRDALQAVVARMVKVLASGRVAAALEEGLQGLEDVLAGTAPALPGENELADGIVEEAGP